jgi:chromate transporter
MVETLVDDLALLSLNDFLIGFGLVQGLPGPMFSFSAWAGGLAAPALSSPPILASLLGMIGLFLPGAILILIMMPLWPALKTRAWVKPALAGILAAAAGLVLATGITLTVANELSWVNGLLIGITFFLLVSQKVPAPLIVGLALIAGFWIG